MKEGFYNSDNKSFDTEAENEKKAEEENKKKRYDSKTTINSKRCHHYFKW